MLIQIQLWRKSSRVYTINCFMSSWEHSFRSTTGGLADTGTSWSQESPLKVLCLPMSKGWPKFSQFGAVTFGGGVIFTTFHSRRDRLRQSNVCSRDLSPQKTYVCIFTFASYRMASVELTSNLWTNQFFQPFNLSVVLSAEMDPVVKFDQTLLWPLNVLIVRFSGCSCQIHTAMSTYGVT